MNSKQTRAEILEEIQLGGYNYDFSGEFLKELKVFLFVAGIQEHFGSSQLEIYFFCVTFNNQELCHIWLKHGSVWNINASRKKRKAE